MKRIAAPITGMAIPRIIGNVKVESPTGFSHALAPQVLVESAEEEVVVESRASIVRSGVAM
jgi:hypothetical protein